jgi:integrase
MTVAELAQDYSGKIIPTLAANTRRMRQAYIGDIASALGPIPAKDLTGADIVGLIERVGLQRGAIVAGKLMGALRGLMAHGVAKRIIAADPSAGIKVSAICGAEPAPRRRLMLDEAEIRVLMTTGALPEAPHIALKIMLGTCVRVSELVGARWEHVDWDAHVWTVPKSKTSSEPFRIPLSRPVARWFTRLHSLARSSAWVLPSPDGKKPRTEGSIREVLRERDIGIRKFSPHDLRSTSRSHLSLLGINPEIAERCLNHHVPGLVGIYDKHDRLDERRHAMNLLGDFLAACENGTPWVRPTGTATD